MQRGCNASWVILSNRVLLASPNTALINEISTRYSYSKEDDMASVPSRFSCYFVCSFFTIHFCCYVQINILLCLIIPIILNFKINIYVLLYFFFFACNTIVLFHKIITPGYCRILILQVWIIFYYNLSSQISIFYIR